MHIALKEKLALHTLTAAAIPLPSRQIQTTTTCKNSFKERNMSVFYTWLHVLNAKIATLSNINTSLGKAVFSGTLETGHSQHAWFQLCPGVWVTFQGEKRNENTKSTSKMQNQNICTYLQIIAFLTRNQSKTFLSTQIHKCKRSVNRLFKGYLLIIYMKHRCDYPL